MILCGLSDDLQRESWLELRLRFQIVPLPQLLRPHTVGPGNLPEGVAPFHDIAGSTGRGCDLPDRHRTISGSTSRRGCRPPLIRLASPGLTPFSCGADRFAIRVSRKLIEIGYQDLLGAWRQQDLVVGRLYRGDPAHQGRIQVTDQIG